MTITRVLLSAALLLTSSQVYGQDPSLQRVLNKTFASSEIATDRSAVLNPGTAILLQKDNLLLYSTACPSSPINSYNSKNGKISQPFGKGFLRDLGGSMQMSGNSTTAQCPQRRFVTGTVLLVSRIDVEKSAIVFHLFSTPDNDSPYYGDLSFPFDKGAVPSPDQALALVSQVLVPQAPGTPVETAATQPAEVVGSYFLARTGSQLQIDPDGTFVMTPSSGAVSPGTYVVRGVSLILTYRATGRSTAFTIQGDKLITDMGLAWVRQGGAPTAVASASTTGSSAPALVLPATYINSQTKDDTLQLKADHTFLLNVAGQTYQGSFQVDGNTIGLKISADTTTNVTIEGDHINDPNGQTWVLQSSHASGGNSEARAGAESGSVPPADDRDRWTDQRTGLMWTRSDNNADLDFNQAVDYCKSLNLGGFSDWRLPEIEELTGISDPSANVPANRPDVAALNIPGQPGPVHIKGYISISGLEMSNTGKPPADLQTFDFGTGKAKLLKSNKRHPQVRALCVRKP
jgi:hypothetical protein